MAINDALIAIMLVTCRSAPAGPGALHPAPRPRGCAQWMVQRDRLNPGSPGRHSVPGQCNRLNALCACSPLEGWAHLRHGFCDRLAAGDGLRARRALGGPGSVTPAWPGFRAAEPAGPRGERVCGPRARGLRRGGVDESPGPQRARLVERRSSRYARRGQFNRLNWARTAWLPWPSPAASCLPQRGADRRVMQAKVSS